MTDVLEVIRTKRDGGALSDEQIAFFLRGYTARTIADEQAAALLMAIVFRGLSAAELATWTKEMIDSGSRLDLSSLTRPTVDKHSTGGVGDKTSLILAPIIAAAGAAMPQVAGRGLGHTGGTLDKLEAIPGWRAQIPNDRLVAQLRDVGAVICGAADDLAPADRRLYALRDVTGTVESIPLIASSIMSKKIAEGTGALVLDVKVGSGAFIPSVDQARELAETMVGIGERNGVRTVALLTDMDQPLGTHYGNGLEVTESLQCLRGGGPVDTRALTLALAEEMLRLVGLDPALAAATLDDGRALAAYDRIIAAQGGDPAATMAEAPIRVVVRATATGFLQRVDCKRLGIAVWRLGAGRARKEDPVSATAGAVAQARVGDAVEEGQPVLELHCDDPARVDGALAALAGAIVIGPEPPPPRVLVIDRIAR